MGSFIGQRPGTLSDQVDAIIEADIKGLAEQYEQRGTPGVAAIISERVMRPGGALFNLLTDLVRHCWWMTHQQCRRRPGRGGWIEFELQDRDAPDGGYLARARPFVLLDGLNLLVGREVRELVRTRDIAINAVIWGSAITLALALAEIAMSRSTTRRIEAINQTSREIACGSAEPGVSTTLGTDDEFDRLAIQLNEMLDRNQSLMEGLRHVTDNIAHDLRTPLFRASGEQLRKPGRKRAEQNGTHDPDRPRHRRSRRTALGFQCPTANYANRGGRSGGKFRDDRYWRTTARCSGII